jgi:hypothetical protein
MEGLKEDATQPMTLPISIALYSLHIGVVDLLATIVSAGVDGREDG